MADDYQRWLENELFTLENDVKILKENRQAMLDFYKHNKLLGISVPRLVKQLGTLRLVSKFVGKSFANNTRQDYESFILHLMESKRSPNNYWNNNPNPLHNRRNNPHKRLFTKINPLSPNKLVRITPNASI